MPWDEGLVNSLVYDAPSPSEGRVRTWLGAHNYLHRRAIRKGARDFVVFHSDNDPYVGLENGLELARQLGVELSFIQNAGHFNKKAGYTKFEKLLDMVVKILESLGK